MTDAEIKQMEAFKWYQELPEIIKQIVELFPPTQLYKFKNSGKQCYIISIEEPESGKIEDVTVTVQKTGVGGVMDEIGLGLLDNNQVFGVKITDIEPW